MFSCRIIILFVLFGFAMAVIGEDINMKKLSENLKSLKFPLDYTTMDLKDIFNQLKKADFKKIMDNVDIKDLPFNVSKDCVNGYMGMSKVLPQYLDAMGKPAAGVMQGNVHWLGSYKECMSIDGAHYCAYGKIFVPAVTNFIMMGMCVPDACGLDDISAVLKYVSGRLIFNGTSLFQIADNAYLAQQGVSDSACYEKEKSYSNGAIVMMFISSVIGFLCILGTITDRVCYYMKMCKSNAYVFYVDDNDDVTVTEKEEDKKEGKATSMHPVKEEKEGNLLVKFLMCFSLIKNTATLFDTTVPPGAITCVNGIRTLSIMWVVLGHTISFSFMSLDNPLTVLNWAKRFTMQTILNATVAVDSFFLLSGLLVGYLSMKRFQTHGTLPLLRYYVHRYIRLTPSYAYLIFFYACIYPYLGSGPFWFTQGTNSVAAKNCIKYWWSNLLYVNNLTKAEHRCFVWSWYLSNDMQFYVISPLILWCMYKLKWIGVTVSNGIFLFGCFIANGVSMHHYHASPLFYEPKADANMNPIALDSPSSRYIQHVYMKPWIRISPYIVGLVLGYMLMNKVVVNKMKNLFYSVGWIVAVGLGVAVVYGPYSVTDYSWKEVDEIIYGVMFRFVWAVALGWVVYACHNGYGGLVNSLMSWRAFIPLSRLTYATYLVHPMVIYLFFFSTQAGFVMTSLNLAFFFVSITTLSFACAYIVAVCIEYPVFNLEKLLLKF